MDTALRTTAEYLKTRKQFGVTLNKFQALTFRAADMYVSLELARSIALWASMVQEAGGDVVQAADRARLQVSRAGRHIGKEAIQLHGGIGVTAEYSVGHYTSRLTAIDHLLGDGDWAAGPAGRERGELRDGRPAGRPVRLTPDADTRSQPEAGRRLGAASAGEAADDEAVGPVRGDGGRRGQQPRLPARPAGAARASGTRRSCTTLPGRGGDVLGA